MVERKTAACMKQRSRKKESYSKVRSKLIAKCIVQTMIIGNKAKNEIKHASSRPA